MGANRLRQQGFTLFELIVVSILIGIIVALGVGYYTQAVKDSQKAGVELLANRFATVAALLHAQWVIDGKPLQIELQGEQILFNSKGWPIGAGSVQGQAANTNRDSCARLWEVFFQNPAKLAVGQPTVGHVYYTIGGGLPSCQYHLITNSSENFYFEYFPSNGKVISGLAVTE